MENKELNIEIVNAWLKEENGMSYDELSNEFEKAVDLLSKSLKQRKEMRDKINKAIEYIDKHARIDDEYPDYIEMLLEEKQNLLNILKEDKQNES